VTLRRRLVVIMMVLVAVGLVAVDVLTLAALQSFLVGRVDSQLTSSSLQVADLMVRAQTHSHSLTLGELQSRVSPDVYVEVLGADGRPIVVRPSGSRLTADPAPQLPHPLPVTPLDRSDGRHASTPVEAPQATGITVGSVLAPGSGHHAAGGPEYRLLATSLSGRTVVVATRLDSVSGTLASLRASEIGLTLGLLVLLGALITVIIRRGLRPLEDMSREADAIAEGDLTRRVHPDDGSTEISRLGRALNGMLSEIESAFAQRAVSEERLRSFLADASHELRTPLTSIQGYAELLRKDALPDPVARARALARIEEEAARMGLLVGDLAVLAREGEGPPPEAVRVDLGAVVAEVVSDARTMDPTRAIGLRTDGPVVVRGDPGRLEQLVHNLVGNALAHTPTGTAVHVSVATTAAADGDRALLVVRDDGPGLTPEQAERVFDRFYRASTSRDGGSGLGLFIVATLARSMGGEATVDSSPGEGSSFTVVLPLAAPKGHATQAGVLTDARVTGVATARPGSRKAADPATPRTGGRAIGAGGRAAGHR